MSSRLISAVSRRRFLASVAASAGGLIIPLPMAHAQIQGPTGKSGPVLVTPWIRIGADDTITLYMSQAEMGQGTRTGVAQILADELEADWSRIRLENAPVAAPYQITIRGFSSQFTAASSAITLLYGPLRTAGACARAMLIEAAATQWQVPRDQCLAREGAVLHELTGRRLNYGALAQAAAALPIPREPILKSPGQFRYIGKSIHRLDTPAKSTGKAQFGIDVRMPGLLNAAIRHCPVMGGKIVGYNEAIVKAMPGVRTVVQTEDALIVVANHYWQARAASQALQLDIEPGPHAATDSSALWQAMDRAMSGADALVARSEGDASGALKSAAKVIEAEYRLPYLAHATLEPVNCTAEVTPDRCTIWAPTQSPGPLRMMLAGLLKLPLEAITIHVTYVGGGFGRKGQPDFVLQAVLASRAVRAPVKLIWSREEDTAHDFYRPAFLGRYRAGLDATGNRVGLTPRIAAPSLLAQRNPRWLRRDKLDETTVEGTADMPYGISHLQVEGVNVEGPVRLGWLRSIGHGPNAFMLESFIDEIAHAGGKDPLALRRQLLKDDPRALTVLDAVARAAGWGKAMPKGRALGIAYHMYVGRADIYRTRSAQIAEVSFDDGGRLKVHDIHVAVDCGLVINPRLVEAQVQGSIGWGLSSALKGAISFTGGQVAQSNFNDYPLLSLAEMPRIHVQLIEGGGEPGGMGEGTVPSTAPAVANAIFALTGRRLRSSPLLAT